jgi:hypothetical protein
VLSEEQLHLLEKMKAAQVSTSQAHRILKQVPAEKIKQALENLPHRNAKNPAGYFVREVLSDDFSAPKALQVESQRQASKDRRKQEELENRAAREAEEEAYRSRREASFAALTPEQLRELMTEARRRAIWARPETLGDDSPVLHGLVVELLEEGWLESRLGRRESKLNLPPPRGWGEYCRRREAQDAQEVSV